MRSSERKGREIYFPLVCKSDTHSSLSASKLKEREKEKETVGTKSSKVRSRVQISKIIGPFMQNFASERRSQIVIFFIANYWPKTEKVPFGCRQSHFCVVPCFRKFQVVHGSDFLTRPQWWKSFFLTFQPKFHVRWYLKNYTFTVHLRTNRHKSAVHSSHGAAEEGANPKVW